MSQPRTLFEKIWDEHVVVHEPGAPAVLYIDLHLVHEVTSPQAFQGLRDRGIQVRRPDHTLATMDHSVPTRSDRLQIISDPIARKQVEQLRINCKEFGVPLADLGQETQGIVHVIGPELGLVHPGMTVACGDSHTATHGAFGTLAFGIGTTQVRDVLASQCLSLDRLGVPARGEAGGCRAPVLAQPVRWFSMTSSPTYRPALRALGFGVAAVLVRVATLGAAALVTSASTTKLKGRATLGKTRR